MFELKDGQNYDVYNNINKDPFTWKEYNNTSVRFNNHQMLEMPITLEDAVLKGSENNVDLMQEVLSSYRVMFD